MLEVILTCFFGLIGRIYGICDGYEKDIGAQTIEHVFAVRKPVWVTMAPEKYSDPQHLGII